MVQGGEVRSGAANSQTGARERQSARLCLLRRLLVQQDGDVQWSFYAGDVNDRDRYRYENGQLVLKAKGKAPSDCSPLWFVTGDHAYEIEVEIDADPEATAGLLLFYNRKLYVGLGYSAKNFIMHSYGIERPGAKPADVANRVHLRLTQRSAHRDDRLQRRWSNVDTVRPWHGGFGLSP